MGFSMTELVESKAWKKFMAKLYGWGASIVIIGALFKIMHWPGAGAMLTVGLCTEAVIFFFSAFEPLHEEIDWTLAYPELAGMHDIDEEIGEEVTKISKKSAIERFDEMIANADISPELFERLGIGLNSLTNTTTQLQDVTDASIATKNYVENFEKASEKVNQFSDVYGQSAQKVSKTAGSLSDAYSNTAEMISQSGNSLADAISNAGSTVNEVVSKSGQELAQTLTSAGKTVNEVVSKSGQELAQTLTSTGKTVNEVVSKSGQELAHSLSSTGTTMNELITKSGQELAQTFSSTGKTVNEVVSKSGQELAHSLSSTGTTMNELITKSGQELADSYGQLTAAMNEEFAKSSDGNKSYGEQLEHMTKNLTALNAVYEMQLQGTQEHMDAAKKMYTGLDEMMSNLNDSIKDTKKYKEEVSKLGQNLGALNTVYGNMLAAMNISPARNQSE